MSNVHRNVFRGGTCWMTVDSRLEDVAQAWKGLSRIVWELV